MSTPPVGSVAVRYSPAGVGVYVQTPEGARVVWSFDLLGGVRLTIVRPLLGGGGESITDYGRLVYTPGDPS